MRNAILKCIGSISILLLLFVGCDSTITPQNETTTTEGLPGQSLQKVTDPSLNDTLANVRNATSRYRNVTVAENKGYHQESPFVPGMGYHYVNFNLLDAEIVPTQPEALVYVDNPAKPGKRRLVAVEYIIPFAILPASTPPSELDDEFPGVDGDKWHQEAEIQAWTLHAWIWYPNPDGMFHPTNPRVGS